MRSRILFGLTAVFLLLAGAIVVRFFLLDGARESVRETNEGLVGSWVGEVQGLQASIAIVVAEDRQAVAYVTDGSTLSEWLRGNAREENFDVASREMNVTMQLSKEAARGNVTLARGASFSFEALPTSGNAGLYRPQETT